MSDSNVAILLDETKAKLTEGSKNSLQSAGRMTRFWTNIPNEHLDDCETVLRARRTETNPKADLREHVGTWRIIRVSWKRGRTGTGEVFEELGLGLATTLDQGEAWLKQSRGSPQEAGFEIVQLWPWVDPQEADNLSVALNAITSVASPQADGETYSGSFVVSEIGDDRNGEGSIAIWRKLALYTDVTDEASLPTPEKHSRRMTLNRLGLEEGDDWDVLHIYSNINPADYLTVLSLSPTESGYTIVDRKTEIVPNKTLTFKVMFDKNTSKWSSDSDASMVKTIRQNPGGSNEGKIDIATGIATSDAADYVSSETTETGFAMDQVGFSERAKGESVINKRSTKYNARTLYTERTFRPDLGKGAESQEMVWRNLTQSDAASIVADAKTNSAEMTVAAYGNSTTSPGGKVRDGHILASISNIDNGNKAFDIRRITSKDSSDATVGWNDKDYYVDKSVVRWRRVRDGTDTVDQARRFQYRTYYLQTDSVDKASKWSRGMIPPHDTTSPIWNGGTTNATQVYPVDGDVRFRGQGRFLGWCRVAKCDPWGSDQTTAIADLGNFSP